MNNLQKKYKEEIYQIDLDRLFNLEFYCSDCMLIVAAERLSEALKRVEKNGHE